MSEVTKTILKTYFNTGDKPTEAQFIDLIDTLLNQEDKTRLQTILDVRATDLTDGTSVAFDCESCTEKKAFLSTAESALTLSLSNFGEVANVVVKAGASVTITLSGTGLKFVDMDNMAAPSAAVDLVCPNTYNEISISDSGDLDSTDRVLLVVKK